MLPFEKITFVKGEKTNWKELPTLNVYLFPVTKMFARIVNIMDFIL